MLFFFALGLFSCDSSNQNETGKELIKDTNLESLFSETITDGQYVFIEATTLVVKWIEKGMLFEATIFDKDYSFIETKFGIVIDTGALNASHVDMDYLQDFKNVERFIAVSDMHGQYAISLD